MTLLQKIGALLGEDTLLEVTADDKYNKQYVGKLDRAIYDAAIRIDPTSNPQGQDIVGNYVDWIIRRSNEIGNYKHEDITKYLGLYHKHKSKLDPQYRDINKLTVSDWYNAVIKAEAEGKFESKKSEKDELRKKVEAESKLIYSDADYTIVSPDTMFASQYLGSGARWCTAWQDDRCMFPGYNDDGTLYIIIDKKNKISAKNKEGNNISFNNKWQIFIPNRKGGRSVEMQTWNQETFSPWKVFRGTAVLNKIEELGFVEPGKIGNVDRFVDEVIDTNSNYLQPTKEIKQNIKTKVEEYREIYRNSSEDETEERYVKDKIRHWLYNEDGLDDIIKIDDEFIKETASKIITHLASPINITPKNIRIVMDYIKKRILDMGDVNNYQKAEIINRMPVIIGNEYAQIKRKIFYNSDISPSVGDNFTIILQHIGGDMYNDFKKYFKKEYSKENWYYNYYDIDKFMKLVIINFPDYDESQVAKYFDRPIGYDDVSDPRLYTVLDKIYKNNYERFKQKYDEIIEYFEQNPRNFIPLDNKEKDHLKEIFNKVEANNRAEETRNEPELKLFPKISAAKPTTPARSARQILSMWEPEFETRDSGVLAREYYKEPYTFDRINLDQLKKELTKEYQADPENFTKYLYDEIVNRFASTFRGKKSPMTDKEKEYLKDMFKQIEAKGYKKDTKGIQQELKLKIPKKESANYSYLDYLIG